MQQNPCEEFFLWESGFAITVNKLKEEQYKQILAISERQEMVAD
jgi:hypothetical protein